jgi:hypothetical protein
MDPWAELGIKRTNDTRAIRSAYAKRLRVTRPDGDPVAYQALREAYERALKLATAVSVEHEHEHEHEHEAEWEPGKRAESEEPLCASDSVDAEATELPEGPRLADVVHRLEQTYSLGGERALRLHAPALNAQLDALPLAASDQAAADLARWVIAEPRLAREWLDALNERYRWTTDFRAASCLPESLALALRVRFEIAGDPARHRWMRIEAMLTSALRRGRVLLALFSFACLSELERAHVMAAAEQSQDGRDWTRERAMLPRLSRWAGYARIAVWSGLLFCLGAAFGTQADATWRVVYALGTVMSCGTAVLAARLVGRVVRHFYAGGGERAPLLDEAGGHAVAFLPLVISGALRPVLARFQSTYIAKHAAGAFLMVGIFGCVHMYRDLPILLLPMAFIALAALDAPLPASDLETRALALAFWLLFSSAAILPEARARYARLARWKRRAGFGLIAAAAGLCMPALATHVGRRQGSTAALTACTAAIVAHVCIEVRASWLSTWVGLAALGLLLVGRVGSSLALYLFERRWPAPTP